MDLFGIATHHPITLDLGHIPESPGPFCMSFGFDLTPLIRSIKEFGLNNPPLVVREEEGRVDVVSGYKRILALKRLRMDKVPCRDITDFGYSPLQLLLLNLHDNDVTRTFNEVEKGMILSRLMHYVSKQETMRSYMPLLGLPSRESTLDLFLSIQGLPDSIKASLVKKDVSMQAIKALLELDPGVQAELMDWIQKLKLTFNQQLQFIELTLDLAIKKGMKISELLWEDPFKNVFENKKLNPPQRAKSLIELLKSMRFPSLTRAEKSFQKAVMDMGLPDGVRITHPAFFEGPDYRLDVLFKDSKQLKAKIDLLGNLDDLEGLTDLPAVEEA